MSEALIETTPSAPRRTERRADAWRAIAVCGCLVLAVLLVFSRTLSQGFSVFDDHYFIHYEPLVAGGLSWPGVVWAFTNGPFGEWYPLSMLSHMLDCQLYGLDPAGHHLTNVLLHAASGVTLFLVLWRMTGALWPSALVAALFALHPQHVESVAWIAERRDVLCGLFFMLTLGAYGEYVRHPRSPARYLAVVVLFALGLMAKQMLVTLPALLLLLDFWPLRRFGKAQSASSAPSALPTPFAWRVVVDKLPLLALSIAAAGMAMATHSKFDNPLTITERLANAAVSCVAYVGQFFVPVGLSIHYSHPEAGRPAWQVAAAVALLLAITASAVIGRRAFPYFFVGWFWYLGMLVPVLGLTSVGGHARADRYTYLPQIGLDLALVWGARQLAASWPARRWVLGIGSGMMLAALMACSYRQTGFWQDDKTLWEHALACNPQNVMAYCILGTALERVDDRGAEQQYRQILEFDPSERNLYRVVRATAHFGLGNIAARRGDITDAIAHYEQAVELNPDYALAHIELGNLLAAGGELGEAVLHFRRSIELAPDNAVIYCRLSNALSQQGENDEAIANFRKAIEIEPDLALAHSNLAVLLALRDEADEAIVHFRRAIEIEPDNSFSYPQIARLLRKQGKTSEAARYDERGKKAGLRQAESQNRRGAELAQQGKVDEAMVQFERVIARFPFYAPAHSNLADALALQGNIDGAILHYRQALSIDPNFAPAKQGLDRLLNR